MYNSKRKRSPLTGGFFTCSWLSKRLRRLDSHRCLPSQSYLLEDTMQTLTRLSQEEDAVPQERIDFVEIDSDFKLQEAIESLKFYYNLARRTNTPLAFELWAPVGSVRPPRLPSHTMKLVEV